MKRKKGFESEVTATGFAEQVSGSVRFAPLPDYMGMLPYWVVEWIE